MLAAAQHHVEMTRAQTGGLNTQPCALCAKAVFHTERVRVPHPDTDTPVLLHRECFRCARCRRPLAPSHYVWDQRSTPGRLYCNEHRALADEPISLEQPFEPSPRRGADVGVLEAARAFVPRAAEPRALGRGPGRRVVSGDERSDATSVSAPTPLADPAADGARAPRSSAGSSASAASRASADAAGSAAGALGRGADERGEGAEASGSARVETATVAAAPVADAATSPTAAAGALASAGTQAPSPRAPSAAAPASVSPRARARAGAEAEAGRARDGGPGGGSGEPAETGEASAARTLDDDRGSAPGTPRRGARRAELTATTALSPGSLHNRYTVTPSPSVGPRGAHDAERDAEAPAARAAGLAHTADSRPPPVSTPPSPRRAAPPPPSGLGSRRPSSAEGGRRSSCGSGDARWAALRAAHSPGTPPVTAPYPPRDSPKLPAAVAEPAAARHTSARDAQPARADAGARTIVARADAGARAVVGGFTPSAPPVGLTPAAAAAPPEVVQLLARARDALVHAEAQRLLAARASKQAEVATADADAATATAALALAAAAADATQLGAGWAGAEHGRHAAAGALLPPPRTAADDAHSPAATPAHVSAAEGADTTPTSPAAGGARRGGGSPRAAGSRSPTSTATQGAGGSTGRAREPPSAAFGRARAPRDTRCAGGSAVESCACGAVSCAYEGGGGGGVRAPGRASEGAAVATARRVRGDYGGAWLRTPPRGGHAHAGGGGLAGGTPPPPVLRLRRTRADRLRARHVRGVGAGSAAPSAAPPPGAGASASALPAAAPAQQTGGGARGGPARTPTLGSVAGSGGGSEAAPGGVSCRAASAGRARPTPRAAAGGGARPAPSRRGSSSYAQRIAVGAALSRAEREQQHAREQVAAAARAVALLLPS